MLHSLSPSSNRPAFIAIGVVLLHLLALAALQSGLFVRTPGLVVPVEMVSQIIESPPPVPTVSPPQSLQPTEPVKSRPASESLSAKAPAQLSEPTPAPKEALAPMPSPLTAAPSAEPISAPVTALANSSNASALAKPASSATAEKIIEPEMVAEHQASEELFRPPRASIQLGEFGQVGLLVTVGMDGRAKEAVVVKSSGFSRLDQTAVRGAMLARYKPAQRGGQPVERKFSWTIFYPEPQR
jgi:periplasmic protein TonB